MNFRYDLFETGKSFGMHIHKNSLIIGDYEILEICLFADVGANSSLLERIDDTLSGHIEKGYLGGNITGAEFDTDKVELYYEVDLNNPATCTLPTWLFREIIDVWLKEEKKHREAKINK